MSEIICVVCQEESAEIKLEILNSDEIFYVSLNCLKLVLESLQSILEINKIFDEQLKN